jgi:glucitol/sorbitol PTS system EIIA component
VGAHALKYRGVIQETGSMVSEFLSYGILIFFGDKAPAELRDMALVHNGMQLISEVAAGDYLKLSPPAASEQPQSYRVTAVGERANANLAQLGHIVIHFDGAAKAKLPGAISVEPMLQALPTIGTIFEFLGP